MIAVVYNYTQWKDDVGNKIQTKAFNKASEANDVLNGFINTYNGVVKLLNESRPTYRSRLDKIKKNKSGG